MGTVSSSSLPSCTVTVGPILATGKETGRPSPSGSTVLTRTRRFRSDGAIPRSQNATAATRTTELLMGKSTVFTLGGAHHTPDHLT